MGTEAQIERLKEASNRHKEALHADISFAVEQTKKVALRVVLLGGGLALAFIIVRALLKQEKTGVIPGKIDKKKPSRLIQMRNFVLEEVTTFLLALAKEKLIAYLQEINSSHVDTEHTERAES